MFQIAILMPKLVKFKIFYMLTCFYTGRHKFDLLSFNKNCHNCKKITSKYLSNIFIILVTQNFYHLKSFFSKQKYAMHLFLWLSHIPDFSGKNSYCHYYFSLSSFNFKKIAFSSVYFIFKANQFWLFL